MQNQVPLTEEDEHQIYNICPRYTDEILSMVSAERKEFSFVQAAANRGLSVAEQVMRHAV